MPENDSIVDPMAKFKNNKESLSYSEHIQEVHEKRKTMLLTKAKKLEEVNRQEVDMDNEDWN